MILFGHSALAFVSQDDREINQVVRNVFVWQTIQCGSIYRITVFIYKLTKARMFRNRFFFCCQQRVQTSISPLFLSSLSFCSLSLIPFSSFLWPDDVTSHDIIFSPPFSNYLCTGLFFVYHAYCVRFSLPSFLSSVTCEYVTLGRLHLHSRSILSCNQMTLTYGETHSRLTTSFQQNGCFIRIALKLKVLR